jgi:hypothetical protein
MALSWKLKTGPIWKTILGLSETSNTSLHHYVATAKGYVWRVLEEKNAHGPRGPKRSWSVSRTHDSLDPLEIRMTSGARSYVTHGDRHLVILGSFNEKDVAFVVAEADAASIAHRVPKR